VSWSQFTVPSAPLRENSLACVGAGEYEGSYERFVGRGLPTHGLVVISKGSGTYIDDGHPTGVPVIAPALIWLFPAKMHGYGPGIQGWTEHWILFSGRATIAFEELGLVSRGRPVVSVDRSPSAAVELFPSLLDVLRGVDPWRQLRASLVCQQIILEAASCSLGRTPSSAALAALAQTAFEPMSMADRARAVGTGIGELRDVVAREHGLTPLDYVIELRMARACELLAESSSAIGEVAAEVGYDDAAYFSRIFSRRVGMSPSAFRDQQRRLVRELTRPVADEADEARE